MVSSGTVSCGTASGSTVSPGTASSGTVPCGTVSCGTPPSGTSSSEHSLYFWPDADSAMDALAGDADATGLYDAVTLVLRKLSADPFSRRLDTALFQTPELGGICATPVRIDDWYVFWQRSTKPGAVEIVLIHRLPVNRPT